MKKYIVLLCVAVALFANDSAEDVTSVEVDKCNVVYDTCANKCDSAAQPDKCYETCDVQYEECASKLEGQSDKD